MASSQASNIQTDTAEPTTDQRTNEVSKKRSRNEIDKDNPDLGNQRSQTHKDTSIPK